MNLSYHVLIIDDHPLIIDAYRRTLDQMTMINNSFKFKVDTANNSDTAIKKIDEAIKNRMLDIVFLDIRLPPSKNKVIMGGEDLGRLIKKKSKKTKIIVSTALNDGYLINCLLKSINPDAFLIKNDLTNQTLLEGIKTVIIDPPYYSKTVMKILRKQSSNDFVIDNIDRKILHELSNGTKMNELPKILPLSIAALERRKRILKDVFNVEGKGDRDLLQIAHQKGFI